MADEPIQPAPAAADAAPVAPASPPTAVDAALTLPEGEARSKAFQEARRAERRGAPLAPPTPAEEKPAVAAAPLPDERKLSKTQEKENERTRRAVEAATADLQRQIRELQAGRTPPPAEQTPPAPVAAAGATKYPTYAEALKLNPDLAHEDYLDLRQEFNRQQTEFKTQREQFTKTATERVERELFAARESIVTASQDATFAAKIDPLLTSLQTFAQAQAAGKTPDAVNVFASLIERSALAGPILGYVADHPEVLTDIKALTETDAVREYFGDLKGQVTRAQKPAASAVAAAAAPQKTLTSASEPPTVLGSRSAGPSDPIAAAMALPAGQARSEAYQAAKRAQRAAAQGSR